jgi:hypothetical protein
MNRDLNYLKTAPDFEIIQTAFFDGDREVGEEAGEECAKCVRAFGAEWHRVCAFRDKARGIYGFTYSATGTPVMPEKIIVEVSTSYLPGYTQCSEAVFWHGEEIFKHDDDWGRCRSFVSLQPHSAELAECRSKNECIKKIGQLCRLPL